MDRRTDLLVRVMANINRVNRRWHAASPAREGDVRTCMR